MVVGVAMIEAVDDECLAVGKLVENLCAFRNRHVSGVGGYIHFFGQVGIFAAALGQALQFGFGLGHVLVDVAPAHEVSLTQGLAGKLKGTLIDDSFEESRLAGGIFCHEGRHLVGRKGTVEDGLQIRSCCCRSIKLVDGLCCHEINIGQTHVLPVDAIVVGRGNVAIHPLVAQFAEIESSGVAEHLRHLHNVVVLSVLVLCIRCTVGSLSPAVRHTGDVATHIVDIVVVEQRGQRSVHTAARLVGVLVGHLMAYAPSVEYTSTSFRERNLPETLTTCCHIVLAELREVVLELTQRVAALVDDVETLLLGNLIHLGRSQVGILRTTETVATQAVASSIESQTGTEGFDKSLAHTFSGAGDAALVGPVAVVLSLFQVGEQLFVDNIAVGTRQVEVLRCVGFETSRHIAPSLDEVVVDHGAQGECLAQQLSHIGIVLHIAIFADALDGQVGTLDALVELGVGIVVGVHLSVTSRCVVVGKSVLVFKTFLVGRCDDPFHIAVDAVVGKESTTIGIGLAKRNVDGHDLSLGKRVDGEYRRFVERRDGWCVHVAGCYDTRERE